MSSYYEKILATGDVKCINDELPYNLPLGWTWCRLNELGTYRKGPFGSSLTKSMFIPKSGHSIKVYEQKNAIQKDYRLGEYYISEDKFLEMQSFVTKPSDIIVSCAGTIGETYLLPEKAPVGIINQALMRVELYNLEIADYWQLFFAYILLIENEMKGAGSAIKNIPPFEYLKAILVPIPPLHEQKRIIEKYDELLGYINHYEHLKAKSDLLNACLFPSIKKSILQEAIQGKLVPQIESEGTAKELLEQIKAEKQKLVKEGKLKKSSLNDSVIYKGDDNKYFEKIGKTVTEVTDEIPFEIPDNWEWCRIGSVLNIWSARRVHEKDWRTSGIPFYRAREIGKIADWGHVNNDLFIEQSLYDEFSKSGVPQIGDLMMTAVGTLGKTYVVETKKPFYYKDGSVLCIGNPFRLNPHYLKLFFESSAFTNQYLSESDGTTVATLTMVRLNRYLIPIPPLMEQTRIVEKIKAVTSIMSRQVQMYMI